MRFQSLDSLQHLMPESFSKVGLLTKKRIIGLGFATICLIILFRLAYSGWVQLSGQDWHIDYLWLFFAFVTYSVTLALAILGWHLIFRATIGSPGLKIDACIYICGLVANRLPGGLWGIAGRGYLYRRRGYPLPPVLATIGIETFFLEIAALVALPFLGLFHPFGQHTFGQAYWILAIVIALGAFNPRSLIMFLEFLRRRIERRGIQINSLGDTKRIATVLAVYVSVWLLGGILVFGITRGLYGLEINTGNVLGVVGSWVAAGAASTLIYFLPSGLGLTELTLTALLSFFMPTSVAALVSISTRFFLTASELFWASVALKSR